MFGQAKWFRALNFGIAPVAVQGWLYYLVWGAVVAVPAGLMIQRGKFIESGVWSVVSLGALAWNSRKLKQQILKQQELDSLFYIGEEVDAIVQTDEYDLRMSK